MRIIIRILWFISLLGFLFNLFTTYGNLKEILGVQIGNMVLSFSRSQYFFFFLALFLILNVALYMYSILVKTAAKELLFIPNRTFWTMNFENRKAANGILNAWMWAIASTINYFLMYWMLVVESQNHFEGSTITSINWFYIPGLFFAATLIAPLVRLLIKQTNMLQQSERD